MAYFRCSNSSGGGGPTIKAESGVFTMTASPQKIPTSFKPKYLVCTKKTTQFSSIIYDEDVSTTQFKSQANGTEVRADISPSITESVRLTALEDDGFTVLVSNATFYGGQWQYVAIG